MAKEFLSSRNVSFEARDIRKDPEALRELVEDVKSRATPTFVAGDRVIVGFDPQTYDEALASMRE